MLTDLKTTLAQFTQQQQASFPSTDVFTLLQQRSDFYDSLLRQLWRQFGFDERTDLALLAVGGYGRREMFPLSDLDILILCEKPVDEPTQQQLNTLFNTLWDSKLQLGAAIRTLDECLDIGRSEISVATNMFESRLIQGNPTLWQALMKRLYQPDFWAIGDFFQAKMAERKAQYARYHNTSYNLEPDLKHSPGGLRDLHLIAWIMLRHYGVYHLEQLLERGILFPEEFDELQHAQGVLFRMRFALHLQLKRYDNRLRFDRQLQLSEQLGYTGEGNQPVEAMMKTFFQATQSISQLSQLLLNSFEQDLLRSADSLSKAEKIPLDELFYRRDRTLFCHNPRIFTRHPDKILDLFWHLTQQATAAVSPQLLRQLRLALRKLDRPLSHSPQARQRFVEIFSQPQMVERAIVPMHQLGVLSAYLPQWRSIEGLMQFDLFHIYTVDEHTVRVMLNLEHFLRPDHHKSHTLCRELLPTLPNLPLLYFAALFHDIAKGREGDHAQNGAVEMRKFAELHGFSPEQTEFMAWLVAEHLTMSITAQRRDIHDPDVVKTFAKIVKTPTALAALTCLTVADICATNENLWNDWKGSLFAQLAQFTREQLALGEQTLDYQQIGLEHRQQALAQLALSAENHHATHQIEQFWAGCPEHYFVVHTATQLLWHAQHFLQNPQQPMVLVSNQYARGATEIFIYAADQPKLFARLAQTLSAKKITIHDAQVLTSDNGLVLDSFIVSEFDGQPLDDRRQQQIQQALVETLSRERPLAFRSQKPSKHLAFKRETTVRFLENSPPNQTALELFTLDREGLLAQIGYIFSQQQLILLNAKITTIGERAEDFFVITTSDQKALSAAEKTRLKSQLRAELDGA